MLREMLIEDTGPSATKTLQHHYRRCARTDTFYLDVVKQLARTCPTR